MSLEKNQVQIIDLVNNQIDGKKATKEEIASEISSIRKNFKTTGCPIKEPILNLREKIEENEDKINKEN